MKVDLTKAEIDLIFELMNLGVKAAGLQAVTPDCLSIRQKLSIAVQTQKPK
jgi:hypothetical protein